MSPSAARDRADAVELAAARRGRMRALVDAIEGGAFGDVSGILHIGIGGSVLGPALARRRARPQPGAARRPLPVEHRRRGLRRCGEHARSGDDARGRASKTFTTTETMANMNAALDWLRGGRRRRSVRPGDRDDRRPETAVEAGVDETRILQFREGVGGRYSLWSAVGLSAALALGWSAFEELLEGAAEMDRHFRYTEPARNAPLLAAFADRLYVAKFGCQTRGVFAYDERLRLLPVYLQQLEMESNGKSVTVDGSPVDAADRAGHLGRDRHRRPARGVPAAPPGHGPGAGRVRRGDRGRATRFRPSITASCCSTPSRRARR